MSEKAPLSRDMLNAIRTMALYAAPKEHGMWKLFGYIDWLEEKLAECEQDCDMHQGWRTAFGHPDA